MVNGIWKWYNVKKYDKAEGIANGISCTGGRRRHRSRRTEKREKASPGAQEAVSYRILRGNGENASGVGITPQQADEILDAGADVITLGNHTWNRREICDYLEESRYILRPANFLPSLPGRGWGVYETQIGPVAVANLIGRCNMNFGPDNPFHTAEKILKDVGDIPLLLDFHAEATSEKLAMAYFLDGRAAAVWGTHTHVQTADETVLPKGTGYLTDLGMVGPAYSVLGVKPEQSIALFRGELTSRFEWPAGPCRLCGAVFTIDSASGKCTSVERVTVND